MFEVESTDALRALAWGLAVFDAVLILLFLQYLRKLYRIDTRGTMPGRFVAAKIGTFVLVLLALLAVALTSISLHHFHGISSITFTGIPP